MRRGGGESTQSQRVGYLVALEENRENGRQILDQNLVSIADLKVDLRGDTWRC